MLDDLYIFMLRSYVILHILYFMSFEIVVFSQNNSSSISQLQAGWDNVASSREVEEAFKAWNGCTISLNMYSRD